MLTDSLTTFKKPSIFNSLFGMLCGFDPRHRHQNAKSPVISMVTGDFSVFSRVFLRLFFVKKQHNSANVRKIFHA